MTDNRYNNGKIYRLVNSVDGEFYVGSTCTSLAKRFHNHKNGAKHKPSQRVYQHLNEVNWANVSIVLVEEFSCDNKMELLRRERYWIEELKPTLNQQLPTRDWKERYNAKKEDTEFIEQRKIYNQEYHEKNKNEIIKRHTERRMENIDTIREKDRISKAKYRAENTDKVREYHAKYRAKNADAINAKNREKYALRKQQAIST